MPYEIEKINKEVDLDMMDKLDFYLIIPAIVLFILDYFLRTKFLTYIGFILFGVFIIKAVIKVIKNIKLKRIKSQSFLDSKWKL